MNNLLRWQQNYNDLKTYVSITGHFPSKHTKLNNWCRYYLITYRANNGVGAKILDQTFVQMSPSGEVFEMTDDMEELVRHPEGTPPGFERIEAMEKASGLFSR